MEQEYKQIPLKLIKADPNQPRKYFDESAMQELTDSINAKGVLQPILLRPSGKGYMIVVGERRLRASNNVAALDKNRNTIPAMIRDMDDEEALELQIIENLQRKDVHPMEEAYAFKSLAEKVTNEEIALRVGKSPAYVAKRIKLTDLVQEAQEVLFHNCMTLTVALQMAKLEHDIQKEIINEELPKDWKKRQGVMIDDIDYYINQNDNDLSKSLFKLNDRNIYPQAGPCTECSFNSANQPLLFDEGKKNKICTRPSCFQIKTQHAKAVKFKAVAADANITCVILDRNLNDNGKKELELAKEAGIQILDNKLYDRVYGEPNKKELKEASVIKAYVVTGGNGGDDVFIRLKSGGLNAVANSTGNAGDTEIKVEISRITEKEKRNKELDAEKIYSNVRTIAMVDADELQEFNTSIPYWAKNFSYATSDKKTSGILSNIAAAFMYESISYMYKDELNSILFGVEDPEDSTIEFYFFESIPDINKIFQYFILDIAFPNGGNENSDLNHRASMFLARNIMEEAVKKYELDQDGIAQVRGERIDLRIKSLKKKLSVTE